MFLPPRPRGGRAGWWDNGFICYPDSVGAGRKTLENIRRRQKRALRLRCSESPSQPLGTKRRRGCAASARRRSGARFCRCAPAGRPVEGGGPRASVCRSCRLAALVSRAAAALHPPETPVRAWLMKPNNFASVFPRTHTHSHTQPQTHRLCGSWQHIDVPCVGRTRPLKSSGTASCCFQARTETDKDNVKEKLSVACCKIESLKTLDTSGSISCLVNRTHIYLCVF